MQDEEAKMMRRKKQAFCIIPIYKNKWAKKKKESKKYIEREREIDLAAPTSLYRLSWILIRKQQKKKNGKKREKRLVLMVKRMKHAYTGTCEKKEKNSKNNTNLSHSKIEENKYEFSVSLNTEIDIKI